MTASFRSSGKWAFSMLSLKITLIKSEVKSTLSLSVLADVSFYEPEFLLYLHCVKKFVFGVILIRIQSEQDQDNSKYGLFSCCAIYYFFYLFE